MRIGFYFECSIKSGGAYQYALNIIEALKTISEHNYTVFNISPDFPYHLVKLPNWHVIDVAPVIKKETHATITATANIHHKASFRRKFNLFVLDILRMFRLYRLEILLTSRNAKLRAKKFDGHNIDIMIYHGPSELSFLTSIPGIVPIHDIEHRLHKGEFRELSDKGQYAKREYLFKNIVRTSFRIFVDSEVSKEDVTREYGADPSKILVVPFVPPTYLKQTVPNIVLNETRKKFKLPEKFLYYPAQFWPHKNHMNLVKALVLLKKMGLIVPVVFSGGKQELWGEFDRVMSFVKSENMESQVIFVGFINGDEISSVYKLASAMIMPVLMGPTYIPIYEAWYMDCPVLYSDIRGPREQAGNAALLFDPHRPEDIAEKIKEFWNDDKLKQDLIERGRQRLAQWTWQDFCTSIRQTINEFKKGQKR